MIKKLTLGSLTTIAPIFATLSCNNAFFVVNETQLKDTLTFNKIKDFYNNTNINKKTFIKYYDLLPNFKKEKVLTEINMIISSLKLSKVKVKDSKIDTILNIHNIRKLLNIFKKIADIDIIFIDFIKKTITDNSTKDELWRKLNQIKELYIMEYSDLSTMYSSQSINTLLADSYSQRIYNMFKKEKKIENIGKIFGNDNYTEITKSDILNSKDGLFIQGVSKDNIFKIINKKEIDKIYKTKDNNKLIPVSIKNYKTNTEKLITLHYNTSDGWQFLISFYNLLLNKTT